MNPQVSVLKCYSSLEYWPAREKYTHGLLCFIGYGRNCRPSEKLNKMLYEHYFCYTFSSALGDQRDRYGNEKKKHAQFLIQVNASNVVIGDHATVRTSPNGGIS